ncbi:MAG: hypothetical protein DMG81_06585 [Acidobacteria bacterium]|nr:MAG: hypothetical protein DMG81_06585 [Acidobacteriota bacterium]
MVRKSNTTPLTPEALEDSTEPQGLGSDAAGQSGDLQGLSEIADADSESVEELVKEGQALEADIVAGVERAGDRESEVHVHERPMDNVPKEYRDRDND